MGPSYVCLPCLPWTGSLPSSPCSSLAASTSTYSTGNQVNILLSLLICTLSSPEANWGSSAQAQVFVNALKGVQVFGVDLAHRFLADLCLFVCSMLHWRSFDAYHNVHFVLLQSLTDTADHVKNYRPKLIVLTGNPATRCLHILLLLNDP